MAAIPGDVDLTGSSLLVRRGICRIGRVPLRSPPGEPHRRRLSFREDYAANQKREISERLHCGGREIPNLSILYASDVLLRPRRAAAP
jgi:hypothetical protein